MTLNANATIIEPQQIVNCKSKDYHGTAFTILAMFWYIWGGQFCPCYCFSIFPINMTYCKTFFDISPILLLLSRNQSSGKKYKSDTKARPVVVDGNNNEETPPATNFFKFQISIFDEIY